MSERPRRDLPEIRKGDVVVFTIPRISRMWVCAGVVRFVGRRRLIYRGLNGSETSGVEWTEIGELILAPDEESARETVRKYLLAVREFEERFRAWEMERTRALREFERSWMEAHPPPRPPALEEMKEKN